MNPLDLLSSPAVTRLGWTLLHSLWQIAAVAAVLWLTLTVLRRRSPQSRYLAAALAMAAVLAATVLTFSLVPTPAPAPGAALAAPPEKDIKDCKDSNDQGLAIGLPHERRARPRRTLRLGVPGLSSGSGLSLRPAVHSGPRTGGLGNPAGSVGRRLH